jgi:hypothetical protein
VQQPGNGNVHLPVGPENQFEGVVVRDHPATMTVRGVAVV